MQTTTTEDLKTIAASPHERLVDLVLAKRYREARELAESRADIGQEGLKKASDEAANLRVGNARWHGWIGSDGVTRTEFEAFRVSGLKPARLKAKPASSDAEPQAPTRASHGTKRRSKKEPRIRWRYFPYPTAIWDDAALPANAKLAAAKVARSINLGPWNTDLHADVSYAAFGLGSVRTAQRAVAALRAAGYIESQSLNRGGVRYWFTDKASGNGPEADKTEKAGHG